MKMRFFTSLLMCIFVCAHTFNPLVANASEYTHSPIVGQNVSEFSSVTLDGTPIDGEVFSEYRLTVVYFWATWSASCLSQLELYQAAYDSWHESGVNVIGLLFEDGTSTVSIAVDYLSANGYTFPNIRTDGVWDNLTSQSEYLPQTFFITSDGTIVEFFPGIYSDYAKLNARIEALIEQYAMQTYTVLFIDGHTGDVIETQQVSYGGAALPPDPPIHAGYAFCGWSGEYSCIVSDTEIIANYVPISDIIQGDANNDGYVTADDALLTLRAALGLADLTEYIVIVSDMNGDGKIDPSDALLLLRYAIGSHD